MPHLILTIEDQPDIRRLIRMALEFKGYEVAEAGDGNEGLRLARELKPAVILLDVMMPDVDGLSVARTLAADATLRTIPVVMISALGAANDIDAGLATGVHAYLVKPFSPWELLDLLATLVKNEAQSTA